MAGLKPGKIGVVPSFTSNFVCVLAGSCFFKCKKWLTFRRGTLFGAATRSGGFRCIEVLVCRKSCPSSRAESGRDFFFFVLG
jgi:hypothetical protein